MQNIHSVNGIFPAKHGDTLSDIAAYCEYQQWNEEEAPVINNLAIVPYKKPTKPVEEIVFQLDYVKDTITGFPLYHPKQIHKDPSALVCAVIKENNQAQQEKYICTRHLDNVIQDVDEEHMNKVAKEIEEESVVFMERLKEQHAPCFREEVDFKDQSLVGVTHTIEVKEGYKRPYIYQIPRAYQEEVYEKIKDMEAKGIIQIGKSEFCAPMTVAKKKNGKLRLCGDFRALNKVTIPDLYPLPRIDKIKQDVRGYVFSVLDLKEGFYQIPIEEQDKAKTGMRTPWGLYVYNRMPFGLRNAPPTFQRFMDSVISGLENTIVYVDDVIIYSMMWLNIRNICFDLFARLEQYGLIINEQKSHFFKQKVEYLGFEITPCGYRPVEMILPRVKAMAPPIDKKGVQKFIGLINYYRSHIPGLAEIAAPLYDLLNSKNDSIGMKQNKSRLIWSNRRYRKESCLVPFRKGAKLSLYTDASKVAAGAVLLQDGLPLEFWSRRFSEREQAYSTNEREALALVEAVLHFQTILQGTEYTAYTDHAALTRWLDNKPVNDRHARWMAKVQHLIHDIQYVPGDLNVLADLMSRPRGLLRNNLNDSEDEQEVNFLYQQYSTQERYFVNALRGVDLDAEENGYEDDIQEEIEDRTPAFDLLKFRRRQQYREEQNQIPRKRRNAMIPTIRKTKPAGNAPLLQDSDDEHSKIPRLKNETIGNDKPKSKRQMKKDKKQQKKHEKIIADLDEWPCYIDRDGWLPADQYEDISDDELQWTQRIIKHQTADFLRDLDIDYANAQIHAGITYLLPDEQSTRQYGKILMPEELRTEAIRRAHGVGHYGQRRTRNKVAQEYYWPSLAKDVYQLC